MLWSEIMAQHTGKVFLVGSGPGSAALLTVQAQQILATAEVLLYDALIDSALLSLVPPNCIKEEVGKRGGKPSAVQAEINDLLVDYCQQGKRVVRLKSGDPFVFGRAQTEVQALKAAGCAYEVVPGLSSALVAPLVAGIPLTDPVLSRCFAVLTAHDLEAVNWQTVARLETLVILMGGRNLPGVVQRLREQGRTADTPIAIIQWATRPQQRIWQGTLLDILEQTIDEALSPCIIVVGEVVRLRSFLQPSPAMSTPPLSGKTVLVTRSATQSNQFSDRLRAEGAIVVEMPALEIVPPSDWSQLDRAIDHLDIFQWLVLTSTNGVEYFFKRLLERGRDVRSLANTQMAVVGEKTAAALKERGIQPDFVPPEFVADSLVDHFPGNLNGAKILFPRVESGGREVLVKDLTAKGAEVTEVAAYQSRCPDAIAPEALAALESGNVDVITFASSKTVQHFCQLLERSQPDDQWQSWLDGVCIASIGPQTTKACQTLLGRVDAEAQEFTLEGLMQAIEDYFG